MSKSCSFHVLIAGLACLAALSARASWAQQPRGQQRSGERSSATSGSRRELAVTPASSSRRSYEGRTAATSARVVSPATLRTPQDARPIAQEAEDVSPPAAHPLTSPVVEGALALTDIEQLALTYHPSLAEYQARVDAARGEWLQAGLYPNPIAGYTGQQIGSRGQAEQDGVIVQGEIVRGGKLRLSRAVAEHQIVQAEMALATQQLRVLTTARKSFYEVLVAQRRGELNDQLVDIGTQGLQTAETLFKAKEVGRADVLQARVESDQARILQLNARNRVTAAWRGLSTSIGQIDLAPQPTLGDLNDNGREYAWETMLQRLLGSSPELALALAGAERARAAVERARVEWVPNLTIQGIVQHDAAIRSSDGALQLTMPIPIFNRNQGGIRQAEGEWIAAEQAVRRLELDLQGRLVPVFERYQNAQQQVERYEHEILPNAKETLELMRASYQAGEVGYLNMLAAQRTYSQTNISYLESLRELWSAIWDMEGLLVGNSPETP